MNPVLIGMIALAVLFLLMFFEMPIAFAMALVGYCFFGDFRFRPWQRILFVAATGFLLRRGRSRGLAASRIVGLGAG